jgi:hypothetical protein
VISLNFIHRQNNPRTQIFYTDDFPDETGLNLFKEVSMQNICTALFGCELIPQTLKLLFTYYGVRRGGEVKFLNRWYCCLKVQHAVYALVSKENTQEQSISICS